MALYEFRHCKLREGRMEDWLDLMQGEIVPFAVDCGMVFCGSFRDEEDPIAYYWIRRFDDEEHRDALYKVFYGSERWQNDLSPRVGELLVREDTVIRRMVPTSLSPMQ